MLNRTEKIRKVNLAKLRIKVKSLAAEAGIIRTEEKKFVGSDRESLYYHRILDVRNEARATQLAIAWFNNKPYNTVERKCKDEGKRNHYIVPRMLSMIRKYGYGDGKKIEQIDIYNWMNREGQNEPPA